MTATQHPSSYALDRGGPDVDAHVAGCAACAAARDQAKRIDAQFSADVLPRTLGRVRARIIDARPTRRWRRLAWIGGFAVAATMLALLLRPREPPESIGWDGIKGSAAATPTLVIFVKRGEKVSLLGPGEALRPGDALRFVTRVDRPRFVELRARDANGQERTLFPGSGVAAKVQPGDALPGGFVVDAAPGPERLTAIFGDSPFPVGRPPAAGLQVIRIELPKEP